MKTCRNCHFLAKEYREERSGRPLSWPVSNDLRSALKSDPNAIESQHSLKCHMGVWDEGSGAAINEREHRLNGYDRRGKCFYYPHHPGMMFNAAEELQRREEEYAQMKRSNLYTRIGLWIAGIGLLASAITSIIVG